MIEKPEDIDSWLSWLSLKWQNRRWKLFIIIGGLVLLCWGIIPMYSLTKRAEAAEGRAKDLENARDTNEAAANSLRIENLRLTRQVQDGDAILKDVKADRDESRRERDEAKNALAPWILLANSVVSNVPPDKRLDLLLEKVEPIARMLETFQQLTNKIDRKPAFEIWVDGVRMTNNLYVIPLDSNNISKINFIIRNVGNDIAENGNISLTLRPGITNVTFDGRHWISAPTPPGFPHTEHVYQLFEKPLNANMDYQMTTLNVHTGPDLLLPILVTVSSAREMSKETFLLVGKRRNGPLIPAEVYEQEVVWERILPLIVPPKK
jgi:hypothetical protein